MVRLVELGPDCAPAQGEAALLVRRYRRPSGDDFYVLATPALDARLPQPFPQGGFGFPSFAAARAFSEGLAIAMGLEQIYLGFPRPAPPAAGGGTIAICEDEAQDAVVWPERSTASTEAPAPPPPATSLEALLDEALEESFPASDPPALVRPHDPEDLAAR